MIKGKYLRQVAGIVISLACILGISERITWAEVGPALADFQLYYLLFGLVALSFGYSMRILRWAVLLQAGGAKVKPRACAAPFLVSITLNNILPFRAGDVVRALVFPAAMQIKRVTATASLVLERLIDLLTLLLCLGAGLTLAPEIQLPSGMKETVIWLSIAGGTAVLGIVLFHGLIQRLLEVLRKGARKNTAALFELGQKFIAGLGTMSRPSTLALCGLLSLLVWLGEAGLFLSVLAGFGLPATVPAALIIMALATLSTLVPSAPGYVGTFHMAAFAGLSLMGVQAAEAASFSIIAHLALWLCTTIPGAALALANPDLFRKAQSLSAEAS
jgi:glycosyltransferase 2 family protein